MSKPWQIYNKPKKLPEKEEEKEKLQQLGKMFEGISKDNLRLHIDGKINIIPKHQITGVRLTPDGSKYLVLVSTRTDRFNIECELKDLGI